MEGRQPPKNNSKQGGRRKKQKGGRRKKQKRTEAPPAPPDDRPADADPREVENETGAPPDRQSGVEGEQMNEDPVEFGDGGGFGDVGDEADEEFTAPLEGRPADADPPDGLDGDGGDTTEEEDPTAPLEDRDDGVDEAEEDRPADADPPDGLADEESEEPHAPPSPRKRNRGKGYTIPLVRNGEVSTSVYKKVDDPKCYAIVCPFPGCRHKICVSQFMYEIIQRGKSDQEWGCSRSFCEDAR